MRCQKRIAPQYPKNDGKQTPMRGHPVFIAQHATATCCRGCIQKWHGIKKGKALSDMEIQFLVEVIMRWIK
jgi:exodeoxyribonuclease V alpha subunit